MNKISTICIIDDDPIFIKLTKLFLQKEKICENFLIFNNGQEAILGLTENEIPKLILLDINMPIMNGWEFLEKFITLSNYKETSIFIVSSSIDHKDIEKAEKHPKVSGFINKPIRPNDLLKILT